MHLVGMDTLLILLSLGPGYHHPRGQDITYSHLDLWCHFKRQSPRPTLCSTIYILYFAKFFLLYFIIFYGLLVGHISSVLNLMLTVPFIDGSP
jgi:hypothetical protein